MPVLTVLLNVPSGSSFGKLPGTARVEGAMKRPKTSKTSRPAVACEQPAASFLKDDVLLECMAGMKSIREQTARILVPKVRYETKSSRSLKTQFMY